MKIKGRGNSTWWLGETWGKKPFQVKFSDKTALLGMPEDKKWIMLAELSDKSFIRNKIARDLSRMSDLEYTPALEYVEVVLNGQPQGIYLIGQKVEGDSKNVSVWNIWNARDGQPVAEQHCQKYGKKVISMSYSGITGYYECGVDPTNIKPSEILKNGKYGSLFPLKDYKRLSNLILDFSKKRKKYNHKIIMAYKSLDRFDKEKSCKSYLLEVQKLMKIN